MERRNKMQQSRGEAAHGSKTLMENFSTTGKTKTSRLFKFTGAISLSEKLKSSPRPGRGAHTQARSKRAHSARTHARTHEHTQQGTRREMERGSEIMATSSTRTSQTKQTSSLSFVLIGSTFYSIYFYRSELQTGVNVYLFLFDREIKI